jgi:hypothetical protein
MPLRLAQPSKKMLHGIQPQFDFEKLELIEKLLRLLVVHGLQGIKICGGVRSGADDGLPIVLRLPCMSTAGRVCVAWRRRGPVLLCGKAVFSVHLPRFVIHCAETGNGEPRNGAEQGDSTALSKKGEE